MPIRNRWVRGSTLVDAGAGEKVIAMLSLETISYFSDDPGSQKYPPAWACCIRPWATSSPSLEHPLWQARPTSRAAFRSSEAFPSEGGALPEIVSASGDQDHWSFWQEGYPA